MTKDQMRSSWTEDLVELEKRLSASELACGIPAWVQHLGSYGSMDPVKNQNNILAHICSTWLKVKWTLIIL